VNRREDGAGLRLARRRLEEEVPVERTVWLRNEHLELGFDRRSGALIAFTAVEIGWEIQGRASLGAAFRLLAPLPGRRNNPIVSEDQASPEVTVRPDGQQVELTWDGLRSKFGGDHPITVKQTVMLDGSRAVFGMSIDNRSPLTLEGVQAPCVGDLRPRTPHEKLTTMCGGYGTATVRSLFPRFDNTRGYWGVDHPTQIGGDGSIGVVPVSPFMLILGRDIGLYAGVTTPDYAIVTWWFELHPGYEDSMDAEAPGLDRIGDHDVAVRFAVGHASFIPPNERRDLTPIAFEPFRGDWHAGADLYRSWREGWMQAAPPPDWATAPHAWLQLHINSPEDELRVPFRELPEIARECAESGISAIQLVGWNDGGQDRGNPSHRPDPRLGTVRELMDAIRHSQDLGVRIVLFSKYVWADQSTDQYREQLAIDAVQDPRGDTYPPIGYRYQTLTQLLDINTRRLIPMCFASERYLRTCEDEFQRVLELGADGVLIDEAQHHGSAWLCFSSNHGHVRPFPVYANDNELIRRFRRRSDGIRPDFLYGGEGLYDWQFAAYQLSYFRSGSIDHIPLQRYLLPHAPLMTAVTGFDDRNMVNQCLLYRYLISFEPFNFKGRPSDAPATIAYGRRMDELRTTLRPWFWDGRFRDTIGARVTDAAGAPHHPFSIFLHAETGEPGVVIANYRREDVQVRVDVDGMGGSVVYRLVDRDEWFDGDQGISLPPRSAVVVLGSPPSQ